MGLFENGREANLQSCISMVEQVLSEMGHGPGAREQSVQHPQWTFCRGSAAVTVSLPPRANFTYLRVVASVLTLDVRVNQRDLFRHLLTLHATEVHGAAFAIYGDDIRLVAERSTMDLDLTEVRDMIAHVSAYADDYDDKLVEKFGGTL